MVKWPCTLEWNCLQCHLAIKFWVSVFNSKMLWGILKMPSCWNHKFRRSFNSKSSTKLDIASSRSSKYQDSLICPCKTPDNQSIFVHSAPGIYQPVYLMLNFNNTFRFFQCPGINLLFIVHSITQKACHLMSARNIGCICKRFMMKL